MEMSSGGRENLTAWEWKWVFLNTAASLEVLTGNLFGFAYLSNFYFADFYFLVSLRKKKPDSICVCPEFSNGVVKCPLSNNE